MRPRLSRVPSVAPSSAAVSPSRSASMDGWTKSALSETGFCTKAHISNDKTDTHPKWPAQEHGRRRSVNRSHFSRKRDKTINRRTGFPLRSLTSLRTSSLRLKACELPSPHLLPSTVNGMRVNGRLGPENARTSSPNSLGAACGSEKQTPHFRASPPPYPQTARLAKRQLGDDTERELPAHSARVNTAISLARLQNALAHRHRRARVL